MIRLALRAYARTWPALLAWFLLGWTLRLILLRLAGAAGNVDPLLGQLILPLAVLVRLASYVAMFLVLRPALTHYDRIDTLAEAAAGPAKPRFLSMWLTTVSTAILPFFVIYAAWGLVADDRTAYTAAALDQSDFSEPAGSTPLDIPFSVPTVVIVVGAFLLRWLLGRFADRLPRWVGIVTVYLEAVWVLIAVLFISRLLAFVPDWLASRRMFAWAVDGWARLQAESDLLLRIGDAIGWISLQLGEAVAQPLAWLALGAIVLAGALPIARRRSMRRTRVDALRDAANRRWERTGSRTRSVLTWAASGFLERWQPIVTAVRLIWRAGPVTMGVYILGFGVLAVGAEWLHAAIYHLLGPHDSGWWGSVQQPIELVVVALTFPLQLCVVAAAFDHCLRALDEDLTSPAAELDAVRTVPR